MLRGSKAARLLGSASLQGPCLSLPSLLADLCGGCSSPMLFVPGNPFMQGPQAFHNGPTYTALAIARCAQVEAAKPASCQGPLAAVTARLISVSRQRHLCTSSHRPFSSSRTVFATPKARAALPVQALEGPKRYAWRQKKWHKKIDKKRPNMPRREPLPPKHPARIIQSEKRKHYYRQMSPIPATLAPMLLWSIAQSCKSDASIAERLCHCLSSLKILSAHGKHVQSHNLSGLLT